MTTDRSHPDRKTCMDALSEFGTPDNVIGHCRAVAAVGYELARRLNGSGYDLDLELVLAAGLLHDIARTEEEHWNVGADFCEEKGWNEEADIVRVHMTYDPFNRLADFNETDVVCLADRVVLEDRYAGLEPRIDYIIEKAKRHGHGEYVPHILRKKKETAVLIEEIEDHLGTSMDEIFHDIDYDNPEMNLER